MNEKERKKFAIGYNGDVELLEKLGDLTYYVDTLYFGLPLNYAIKSGRSIDVDLDNLKKISESCKKHDVKRILLFNSPHFLEAGTIDELLIYIKDKLIPLMDELKIDDIITNNSLVGNFLKETLGNKIHLGTSTLNNISSEEQIERFKKSGFDYFTLSREATRDIELIKNLAKKYKIKVMTNESCLRFCEYQSQHIFYAGFGVKEREDLLPCRKCQPKDFFKSNWMLPRWLDKLDDYVYRYKLITRCLDTENIVKAVKAYGEGNEVDNLLDIIESGTTSLAKGTWGKIDTRLIPDEILESDSEEEFEKVIEETIKKIEESNHKESK